MSVLYCRSASVARAGIGSAAADVAPNRRAAANSVKEVIDFMMKGDGRGLEVDGKVSR